MNILILGASTKASIGYMIGETLRTKGHLVTYASRSGQLGMRCNIILPPSVRTLLRKIRPDAVIFAAGVFMTPKPIGEMEGWRKIRDHIGAKAIGPLIVCDALARQKKTAVAIMLGGRESSSQEGFAPFTVGNGALWSLVRFLNSHTRIDSYFIDLPFVQGSAMQKSYIRSTKTREEKFEAKHEIGPEVVAQAVLKIFQGKEKKKRIVLGSGTA